MNVLARIFCLSLIVLLCSLVAGPAFAEEPVHPQRAREGLLALYTFEPPGDNIIRDRSGHGEPLDLRVETLGSVSWRDGALVIGSSARIRSEKPARRLTTAIQQTGELTIEAWLSPVDSRQTGPARVVTLSCDTSQRNFTLGQDGSRFDVRLRTSATNTNGIPSLGTPESSVASQPSHVVFTRDAQGRAALYVAGKLLKEEQRPGDLGTWSGDYHLSLGNEATNDRPWLGELRLVALYSRALTDKEVAAHASAGVPMPREDLPPLPPATPRTVDFARDVQPILKQHCHECHGGENEEGGLNLGQRQRLIEGGATGLAVKPGDSLRSRLIHRVATEDDKLRMPPGDERLSAEQIGILRAWIDQGMVWPEGAEIPDPRQERAREHWAFRPLQGAPLPAVRDQIWCRTPIDYFIRAKQESAGLHPSPPARPEQIVRRAFYDVVGLPPDPDQLREWTEAIGQSPDSGYDKLIDWLLSSPHFGERWGRHWLDVAHYADSNGMEGDHDRPFAYPYRDFVIRAWNEDLPYDEFVRWQIAGDEIAPTNPRAIAATGFLATGPHEVLEARLLEFERLRSRYNELDDMLSTIGSGILGLTLGCARCHDHKYDAIPARDYYRMLSALHSGDRAEATLPDGTKALVYRDFDGHPRPTWLFRRADFYDRQRAVQLGFVSFLTRGKGPDEFWEAARGESASRSTTYQRRALAEWLTDVDHGAGALVARVIVNRLWQHHFGEPLVATVGDFGVRASPPSHPELLEWLAADLVRNGWHLKRLHKLMLTSATYRQGGASPRSAPSTAASTASAADVDNRLMTRMRPRRLEAEILRDAFLSVSGTLNRHALGPAFKPPIATEAMLARNLKNPYPKDIADSGAVRRRSVYMFHKRVVPYPMLQAFDKPDAQQSCGRRDQTTVAPQALTLLNDPAVRSFATDFADRLLHEQGHDRAAWVERAFVLALSREPSEFERQAAMGFLEVQWAERRRESGPLNEDELLRRTLADFCQAMFSLNEFIYID